MHFITQSALREMQNKPKARAQSAKSRQKGLAQRRIETDADGDRVAS